MTSFSIMMKTNPLPNQGPFVSIPSKMQIYILVDSTREILNCVNPMFYFSSRIQDSGSVVSSDPSSKDPITSLTSKLHTLSQDEGNVAVSGCAVSRLSPFVQFSSTGFDMSGYLGVLQMSTTTTFNLQRSIKGTWRNH